MSGHGHPSSIDLLISMVFLVDMPLPLSNSTLAVSSLCFVGIYFKKLTVSYYLLLCSSHRIYAILKGVSMPSAFSTPSMSLSFCPQSDCLAYVLFQHPQQHSLRLQGLASWCKVNHNGGKEDGERAREREQAKQAVCFLSLFRTRGRNSMGRREEEVCLQYQHITNSSRSWDTSGFCHEEKSLCAFCFLLVMSHITNPISKNKKTMSKSSLHLH